MMKKLFATAVLAIALPAHAGFWDSLFGGGENEEPAQAPAAQSASAPTPAPSMVQTGLQLLPLLTQSLGVSDTQASGGMGSILQAGQTLLSNSEFATLAKAIPGAETLMQAAPLVKEANSGSLMDKAMNMASGYSPEAKAGTQLVSQFKSLGMGPEMIPKFSDVGVEYLQQKGYPEAGAILQSLMPAVQ